MFNTRLKQHDLYREEKESAYHQEANCMQEVSRQGQVKTDCFLTDIRVCSRFVLSPAAESHPCEMCPGSPDGLLQTCLTYKSENIATVSRNYPSILSFDRVPVQQCAVQACG